MTETRTDTSWQDQEHPFTRNKRTRPRPQLLVWVILFAAAFPFRFDFAGRTISLFDVAIVAAVVPWVVVLTVKRSERVPWPLIALGSVSLLLTLTSVAYSQDKSASVFYFLSSAEGLLALLILVTLLRDAPPRQVVRLTTGYIIMLMIPATLLWMRVPGFLPPSELDPTQGDYLSYFVRLSHPFIGRSNNFAALMVVFIIPLAVWALTTKQIAARIGAFVALVATVLTFSRGAFLSLTAAFVLYFLVDGKNARRLFGKAAAALIPVAIIAFAVILFNSDTNTDIGSRLNDSNVTARYDLWQVAQILIGQNWLIGTGAGVGIDVHNTFVQQMIYFGVAGGALIGVLLIASVFWWLGRRREQRWLAAAIGIGIVAQVGSFLVESSYEGSLLRPEIWLTWALLVALYRATIKSADVAGDTIMPAS